MTSSNATSDKSRVNTYIAIVLGIICFGLVVFLLFRVDQMEKDFGHLRDNRVTIEQQITNARVSKDFIVGQISKLKGQRNDLRVKIAGLKAAEDNLAILKANIEKAGQKFSQLQGDLGIARTVISKKDNAENLLDSARLDLEDVNKEIGKRKSVLSQQKKNISEGNSRATKAKTDADDLVKVANHLKTENAKLKSQKSRFEKKVADLERLKNKSIVNFERLKDNSTADLERLEGQSKIVSETLAVMNTRIRKRQSEADTLKDQVSNATSDLLRLQHDIHKEDQKQINIVEEVNKNQEDLTELKLQISQKNYFLGTLDAAEVRLKVVESRLANDKAELEATRIDWRAAKDLAGALKADYKNLQVKLINEQTVLSGYKAEKEAQIQKLNLAKQDLFETNSTISGLKKTMTDLTERYEKIHGDIKAERNTLLLAKNELARIKTEGIRYENDEIEARELTARIVGKKVDLDKLYEDIIKQKAVLRTASVELSAANLDADIARKGKKNALAAVEKLKKDKDALVREIENETEKKGKIAKKIESLEQRFKEAKKLLVSKQGRIVKTENDLRSQSTKLRSVKRDLNEVNAILGEMNGMNSNAQMALTETQRLFKEANIDLQNTRADLTTARIELGAARNEIQKSTAGQKKEIKK